jgi:GNAT superfamily N-acetyltransferase
MKEEQSGVSLAVVRPAQRDDAGAVLALAADFATSFVVEPEPFLTAFTVLLEKSDAYLAVAEEQGVVVGYVLGFIHPTFYANGPVGWVEEIAVRADQRRSGIGRRLMQSFEAWAAGNGCRLAALATRRAAAFYLALGYEESATYFRKLGIQSERQEIQE